MSFDLELGLFYCGQLGLFFGLTLQFAKTLPSFAFLASLSRLHGSQFYLIPHVDALPGRL
jgi:hypothetical protein